MFSGKTLLRMHCHPTLNFYVQLFSGTTFRMFG